MACNFCKKVNSFVDVYRYNKEKRPSAYGPDYRDELVAMFVHRVFYKGLLTTQTESEAFPLNFCPECGKKIEVLL